MFGTVPEMFERSRLVMESPEGSRLERTYDRRGWKVIGNRWEQGVMGTRMMRGTERPNFVFVSIQRVRIHANPSSVAKVPHGEHPAQKVGRYFFGCCTIPILQGQYWIQVSQEMPPGPVTDLGTRFDF